MREHSVVVVVATLNRPAEVARLVKSLVPGALYMAGVVIVDNGRNLDLNQIYNGGELSVDICRPQRNLGCGGGLHFGMKSAREKFGSRITHFVLLDDDAVLPPDAIGSLIERGQAVNADVIYPMVVDREGRIGWFPGLRSALPWKTIRQVQTPGDYLNICGPEPVPFSWSPGVCLLVSRTAVQAVGFPAVDFWVRGEDLEYSLRLTSKFRSAFIPDVVVQHLVSPSGATSRAAELLKHLAMLQNLAYMATRLPYGRRILRHLPGNIVRFFRANGYSLSHFGSLCAALWLGMFAGRPAGANGYNVFEKRYARLTLE